MFSIRHELPLTRKGLLLFVFCFSFSTGLLFDWYVKSRIDDVFHDIALVTNPTKKWEHTAIVALDGQVPGYVGRRQSLGLFALASKRLFELGASAIFLDARLYEPTNNLLYAQCVSVLSEAGLSHSIQWDNAPNREVFSDLTQSEFSNFYIATPSFDYLEPLEVSLFLQSYFGQELLPVDFFDPNNNLLAQQRLFAEVSISPKKDIWLPGLNRWMNIGEDSVVHKLSSHLSKAEKVEIASSTESVEQCTGNICKRARFSYPIRHTNSDTLRPVLPVSEFSTCDENQDLERFRAIIENRAVILQLSQPEEATDLILTPMATAFGSPRDLLPGPQFIADSIETHIKGHHPARPDQFYVILLLSTVALVSALSGAYLKSPVALSAPFVFSIFPISFSLAFTPFNLWPVAATFITSLVACSGMLLAHIAYGTSQSKVASKYLPRSVRELLIKKETYQEFSNERHQAAVLMSDLRKYTTITTELEKPEYVFDLINKYFEDTTLLLQDKYGGWLEGYVGDMVIYYWPEIGDLVFEEQINSCLKGAIELTKHQKHFFESLESQNFVSAIPKEKLRVIQQVIGAGTGLTTGEVVMGNLGPRNGVQKFSTLGDPLNLASRVEALTRHFNTEIIITEELKKPAEELGYKTRKLVAAEVKGRPLPITLYAMSEANDPRLSNDSINVWEEWLNKATTEVDYIKPIESELFKLDSSTIINWKKQGLLDTATGVFKLTEK